MSGGPIDSECRLTCGICGQLYDEPRILPCLHTFCTKCIEGLDSYITEMPSKSEKRNVGAGETTIAANKLRQIRHVVSDSLGSKLSNKDSAASTGYESDKSPTSTSWSPSCSLERGTDNLCTDGGRTVLCPTCDSEVDIPIYGVSHLPLHYVFQNKLLQMSLDNIANGLEHSDHVKQRLSCELCIGEVTAVTWCSDCLIGLCGFCSEAHKRQRSTEGHRTIPIQIAIRKGLTRKVNSQRHSRRVPVCSVHPTEELRLYCKTCNVTVCRDCIAFGFGGLHVGHPHCPVDDVAHGKVTDLRQLLDKALPQVEAVRASLAEVRATAKRIRFREAQVISEIDDHFDGYAKAVEEHRNNLKAKVIKSCEVKQRILKLQTIQMEQALEDLETSCDFVKELLADGTDVEVVTLLGHVGRRIHELGLTKRHRLEPLVDHFLQFVPDESDGLVSDFLVKGLVTAQRVAPHKSTIKNASNGVSVAKQGRNVDLLLMTKDSEGQPMRRGGAFPKAELVSRESPSKTLAVKVIDRKDGTYQLAFKSDDAGLFWLTVTIQDQHIQGSPFPIPIKANSTTVHSGIYHCCTFCSSGGSKEARCGCAGKMPGGFKGCGHGHEGHPGKRHWSCCGQTTEGSECIRPTAKLIQFTI